MNKSKLNQTVKNQHYFKSVFLIKHSLFQSQRLKRCSNRLEDIWISWIADDHGGDTEESTKSGSELDVVSFEVVNIRLSKHCVVLKFGLSDGWAVVGNQDELWLSGSESLDGVSVSNAEFSRLNDKVKLTSDVLLGGLLLLHLSIKSKEDWYYGHMGITNQFTSETGYQSLEY